ncbi:MAG: amidohydrolase family protein [Alphaproteobacteria bacterium]|nr:amidohydrolase family protein [Alphaproteobacteria bacterium]
MRRRSFLAGSAACAMIASGAAQALDDVPIIDAHMHLFDATRPQGAPYTGSPQFKGGQSLPAPYIAQARAAGISGAMAMEASGWIEDNLWLMERVESASFFVGMVGMLEPDKPDFPATLERFAKNRLFRGIRYGKLWGLNISTKLDDAAFIAGLRRLAAMGLVLDTANIDMDLLQTVVRLTDKVPALKIVLDHSPAFAPRPADREAFAALMREIGGRPGIATKLSWNVITAAMLDHVEAGKPVAGLSAYRDRLDMLTATFGEDRVMFCSNYPQTVGPVVTTVSQISALAKAYYVGRPGAEAEKFFWKNAQTIYGWIKRDPSQPGP